MGSVVDGPRDRGSHVGVLLEEDRIEDEEAAILVFGERVGRHHRDEAGLPRFYGEEIEGVPGDGSVDFPPLKGGSEHRGGVGLPLEIASRVETFVEGDTIGIVHGAASYDVAHAYALPLQVLVALEGRGGGHDGADAP